MDTAPQRAFDLKDLSSVLTNIQTAEEHASKILEEGTNSSFARASVTLRGAVSKTNTRLIAKGLLVNIDQLPFELSVEEDFTVGAGDVLYHPADYRLQKYLTAFSSHVSSYETGFRGMDMSQKAPSYKKETYNQLLQHFINIKLILERQRAEMSDPNSPALVRQTNPNVGPDVKPTGITGIISTVKKVTEGKGNK